MLSCARIFRHTQANGQAQQLCGCWAEGVGVSLREANIVQQWVGSGLRVTLRGICNQLCPSMRGLVFGGATSPKPPPFYITGGHFPPRPPRHLLQGALPPNPRTATLIILVAVFGCEGSSVTLRGILLAIVSPNPYQGLYLGLKPQGTALRADSRSALRVTSYPPGALRGYSGAQWNVILHDSWHTACVAIGLRPASYLHTLM